MPEPKTATEWTDLLLAWYEGHPATSQAFRDEIARVLVAFARQHVEAWQRRTAKPEPARAEYEAEYEAEAIICRIYKAIGADVGEAIVLDEDAKSVIRESLIRWTMPKENIND